MFGLTAPPSRDRALILVLDELSSAEDAFDQLGARTDGRNGLRSGTVLTLPSRSSRRTHFCCVSHLPPNPAPTPGVLSSSSPTVRQNYSSKKISQVDLFQMNIRTLGPLSSRRSRPSDPPTT